MQDAENAGTENDDIGATPADHVAPLERETDHADHTTDSADMLQRAEGANEPLHDQRANFAPGERETGERDPDVQAEREALVDRVQSERDDAPPTPA